MSKIGRQILLWASVGVIYSCTPSAPATYKANSVNEPIAFSRSNPMVVGINGTLFFPGLGNLFSGQPSKSVSTIQTTYFEQAKVLERDLILNMSQAFTSKILSKNDPGWKEAPMTLHISTAGATKVSNNDKLFVGMSATTRLGRRGQHAPVWTGTLKCIREIEPQVSLSFSSNKYLISDVEAAFESCPIELADEIVRGIKSVYLLAPRNGKSSSKDK